MTKLMTKLRRLLCSSFKFSAMSFELVSGLKALWREDNHLRDNYYSVWTSFEQDIGRSRCRWSHFVSWGGCFQETKTAIWERMVKDLTLEECLLWSTRVLDYEGHQQWLQSWIYFCRSAWRGLRDYDNPEWVEVKKWHKSTSIISAFQILSMWWYTYENNASPSPQSGNAHEIREISQICLESLQTPSMPCSFCFLLQRCCIAFRLSEAHSWI